MFAMPRLKHVSVLLLSLVIGLLARLRFLRAPPAPVPQGRCNSTVVVHSRRLWTCLRTCTTRRPRGFMRVATRSQVDWPQLAGVSLVAPSKCRGFNPDRSASSRISLGTASALSLGLARSRS